MNARADTRQKQDTRFDQPSGGALAVVEPRIAMPAEAEIFEIDKSKWRVLVEATFPSAKSAAAVIMALEYCRARKLDIFKRPVHIVPMYSTALGRMVETVWPSIAELRTTAFRTGQFAGIDAIEWGPVITETFNIEKEVWENGRKTGTSTISRTVTFHKWARMTVYRSLPGQNSAPGKFFGPEVYWLEICAKDKNGAPNDRWLGNPNGQHEKTAEAAALRRVFPEELGNEYSAEEMEGQTIFNEMKDITPLPAPAAPPADDPKPTSTTLPPQPDEDDKPAPPTISEIEAALKDIATEDALTSFWNGTVKLNWGRFASDEVRQKIKDIVGARRKELAPKEQTTSPDSVKEILAQFQADAEKSPDFAVLDKAWRMHVDVNQEAGKLSRSDIEGLFLPVYDKHRNRIDFGDDAMPGDA